MTIMINNQRDHTCCICGQTQCSADCCLRGPYERVMRGIQENTVTEADFNALLEVFDKSARERVARRTRPPRAEPAEFNPADRVAPKHIGRNDPPRQGRGRRYASGTPQKQRQNQQQAQRVATAASAASEPLDPTLLKKALEAQTVPATAIAEDEETHEGTTPINLTMAKKADFLTLPVNVTGANCFNCEHNLNGVCQYENDDLGISLKGQPVTPRDHCQHWCAPGTIRMWQKQQQESATEVNRWRGYALVFDKPGYINNLKDEMQKQGLVENTDWRLSQGSSQKVLWLRPGLTMTDNLKDWLLQVGRATPLNYDPRSIFS